MQSLVSILESLAPDTLVNDGTMECSVAAYLALVQDARGTDKSFALIQTAAGFTCVRLDTHGNVLGQVFTSGPLPPRAPAPSAGAAPEPTIELVVDQTATMDDGFDTAASQLAQGEA